MYAAKWRTTGNELAFFFGQAPCDDLFLHGCWALVQQVVHNYDTNIISRDKHSKKNYGCYINRNFKMLQVEKIKPRRPPVLVFHYFFALSVDCDTATLETGIECLSGGHPSRSKKAWRR